MIMGSIDVDFENLEYDQMNEMKAPNNDSEYYVTEKKDRCIVHIEISTNRITNKPMIVRPMETTNSHEHESSTKKRKLNSGQSFKKQPINEWNNFYNTTQDQNDYNDYSFGAHTQNKTIVITENQPESPYNPVPPDSIQDHSHTESPYNPVSPGAIQTSYQNPFDQK